MLKKVLVLMFLIAAFASNAFSQTDAEKIEQAKKFFEEYVALGKSFDLKSVDLYASSALIKNTRRYPDGTTKELTFPPDQYKSIARMALPLAKARGDMNEYSELKYTLEGDKVRIKASRFSLLKKYFSPFELLVGPDKNGTWLIWEEISESQP